jgi:glycosyltransferase involved in cell wall biosynthesis
LLHQGDFTYYLPALATLRNKSQRPIPLTGITHSLDGPLMHRRFFELAIAGLAPFDGIICTSKTAERFIQAKKEELAQIGQHSYTLPVETTVIPLGIDENQFSPGDKQRARNHLCIPQNRTVVLSVARISLRSKCDLSPFLELLSRMRSEGKLHQVLFLLAGGGSKESIASVQKIIDSLGLSEQVVLIPNFSPKIKPYLYQAADLALSLVDNYQETFGLSIIEAMASGLPIIAADFDGYRDSVHHNENGFLVPTLAAQTIADFMRHTRGILDPSVVRFFDAQAVGIDLESLEESLVRLLRNHDLRKRMGENAVTISKNYHWKAIIPRYEAFWSNLLEKAAHHPVPLTARDCFQGGSLTAYTHFPTAVIEGSTWITSTKLTTVVQQHPEHLVRYDDLDSVWNSSLETWLLEALVKGPQQAKDLHDRAHHEFGTSAEDVNFHLLWLIKHGALSWRQ